MNTRKNALIAAPTSAFESDIHTGEPSGCSPIAGSSSSQTPDDFGRIAVVEPGQYSSLTTLAHLGPEPFDDEFTPEFLRARLHQSTQAIKTQLMSQRVVAGLGNIYVDEALWAARVNPRSTRVTKAQSVALHDSIVSSLEAGIRNGGTTLRDYRDARGASGNNQLTLKCYGRSGLPCLHCGGTLARTVISGRSTTFCPLCQRRK
ncbi:MAG: zinc finger domain-containing protein [Microthrixaceae bacterium]